MIVGYVTFEVLPGKRDTFIEAAAEVMRQTQEEPGCVVYSYGADLADSHRFHIIEIWADKTAMDRHLAQPHTKKAMPVILSIARISSLQVYEGALETLPRQPPSVTPAA